MRFAAALWFLLLLALLAGTAQAQTTGSSLALEVAVAPSTGTVTRTVAVRAVGVAAPGPQRLYVAWDADPRPCPGDMRDLPSAGGWVFEDAENETEYLPVGPGPFDLSRTMELAPGRLRLCGYLIDEALVVPSVPVVPWSLRVLPDPSVRLTRAAAIDALLSSPRVHRDVKGWILQGELTDEHGLGVNGSVYLRLRDLTGDGMPEAIARPSAGGSGRVQAYYIVTNDGGVIRVVAAVRKALDGRIEPVGAGFREVIPRFAPADAACCAGKLSIRRFRWDGRRFTLTGRRVVRTRFATAIVPPGPRAAVS